LAFGACYAALNIAQFCCKSNLTRNRFLTFLDIFLEDVDPFECYSYMTTTTKKKT